MDRIPYKLHLEPGEFIYKIYRKHWAAIFWSILGISVLSLFPILVLFFIAFLGGLEISVGIFALIFIFWYGATFTYGASEWYAYTHSALIITNQRVIDHEQNNFLSKRVQTIDLHEVQSASGEPTSGWGTVLHYGNLRIFILGEKTIAVRFMPNPDSISEELMCYHNLVAHGMIEPDSGEHSFHEHQEQAVAVTQGLPMVEASNKLCLLMFHIPSENMEGLRDKLPAIKEPSINYLPHTDYYEVEIILPCPQIPGIVSVIKKAGAVDIFRTHLESLEETEMEAV